MGGLPSGEAVAIRSLSSDTGLRRTCARRSVLVRASFAQASRTAPLRIHVTGSRVCLLRWECCRLWRAGSGWGRKSSAKSRASATVKNRPYARCSRTTARDGSVARTPASTMAMNPLADYVAELRVAGRGAGLQAASCNDARRCCAWPARGRRGTSPCCRRTGIDAGLRDTDPAGDVAVRVAKHPWAANSASAAGGCAAGVRIVSQCVRLVR
jgi:hypothetical protein